MRHVWLLPVLLFVSGCAGFHSNELAKISENSFAKNAASKPKLYFTVLFDGNMEMRKSTAMESTVREEFARALLVTDCCVVAQNEEGADVKIKAKINKYENPAALIPAILTGASLYTIPSWATIEYTLKADVTDKTAQSREYSIVDSWTLVQWLPMMFAFPVATPQKAEEGVFRDLSEHLLYKLHQDKLI